MEITTEEFEMNLETKKLSLSVKVSPRWKRRLGSNDGAEVADLVGLFLLSKLSSLNVNVGLYRDDGLAVCNLKPRLAELERNKLGKQ